MLKLGYLSGRLYKETEGSRECTRFIDEKTASDPHAVAKLANEMRQSCDDCEAMKECLTRIKSDTPNLHVL